MSGVANTLFTGTSTFSKDFSQVITRAVQIASLPIDQLNSDKTSLSNEKTALSGLADTFASLQSSVSSLNSALGVGRYSVSLSDNTVVSASVSSGALPGTYHIEVVDPGSKASAASTGTVSDPSAANISNATSFTLTVGGKIYSNIRPSSSSLNSLANAINSATQGAVQATVVNIGLPSSPSYELSIQNGSYGAAAMSLDDGSGNILGASSAATFVQYRIDGQPPGAPLSADTRTLTVAPNISATVLKAGTTDITLSQGITTIANALNSFVQAYNAATTALDAQRGSSNGALSGQSTINSLSQSLRDIVNYSGTGSVQSVADLGLSFDKDGVLSLDSTVLAKTASADFKGVTDFLGSATGSGFLRMATNSLKSITDPVSGLIPAALTSISGQITDTDNLISENQDRVDRLSQDLTAQMSAADALIASLQQQATYLMSMFSAMQTDQSGLNK